MDWEDFDEDFDELVEELMRHDEEEGQRTPHPTFRATIRDGSIWIRGWQPRMLRSGEGWPGDPAAEVGLADLSVIQTGGKRELIVRFIRRSPSGGDEETLLDWAARTGYSRAWLDDRLVNLEVDPERLGKVETSCPTCGTDWVIDGDPEFWAGVLKVGFFPDTCTVCGNGLPEWRS